MLTIAVEVLGSSSILTVHVADPLSCLIIEWPMVWDMNLVLVLSGPLLLFLELDFVYGGITCGSICVLSVLGL